MAALACVLCLRAEDFSAERAKALALGDLTTAPAVHSAQGYESTDQLKAIYFDGPAWKGKPTRVFAWLGLPEQSAGEKVPGIVLVHGGGGTAFREWVEKWTARGYAAIAIATEGQTDQADETPKGRAWKRSPWGGPARDKIFADSDEPLEDQWIYQAVAQTVLANSLLRSLPEVDANKVGVMGISWGGVVTSTVIGIDSRFAFAIPTYGCGHLFDAANQWGAALGDNQTYRQVWDPMVRMTRVKTPTLWLSWPQDNHFPLDCQAACYRSAPGPHMVALIPGMRHSHPAGWAPPDSYAFADSIVQSGRPWIEQTAFETSGAEAQVSFRSAKPLDRALLIWTKDTGFTGTRDWIEAPAALTEQGDHWRVTASVPREATAWFVNVRSGDLTASSDYQER
ncbi:MAG: acetylxylan esterase [Bryobacterales bacterium]|nr:acetylxylan esterase [Acidobacteriota bacterium]MCB9385170.1 acetylxylan esterase [Bryobacterales bacterium]